MQLPDFTSLATGKIESVGVPTPQPSQKVASTPYATAPGEALSGFGQQLANSGYQLKDIMDVADVNNAMANTFQPQVRELAQNYYSLSGKAAMDGADGYAQQVQDAMNNTADQLSGSARTKFIGMATPIVDRELYRSSSHAGEQARVYYAQSNDAIVGSHATDYQNHIIGDPNTAADDKMQALIQQANYLKSVGVDPTSTEGLAHLHQLEDNFEKLRLGAIESSFKGMPPDQQVAVAHTWMDKSAGAQPPAPALPNIQNAILQQESGNNVNSASSSSGAIGRQQIMPATFQQWAKPGESMDNDTDRQAVFNRMTQQYYKDYNGDPARIAVAYFSGPGNVAPAGSPTPWKNDAEDSDGTKVSQYVQSVTQRMNASGAMPAPHPVIATPAFMGQAIPGEMAAKLTEVALANKEHQDRLQKLNDESNFNQVQQDFFQKEHNNSLTWDDINSANLPVQGAGGKNWWQERLDKPADKTDPAVYNQLFQRATLPDGDPNKLTDPKELLGYVGKGITDTNMKQINEVMQGGDEGKTQLRDFLKQGHDQLSQSNMMNIDGEGEARAYRWTSAMMNRIQQGQAKGLSVHQMIDPNSKDYIGGDVQNFTATLEQQSNNLAQKIRGNTPAEPLPAEKLRKEGESPEDYIKRVGL